MGAGAVVVDAPGSLVEDGIVVEGSGRFVVDGDGCVAVVEGAVVDGVVVEGAVVLDAMTAAVVVDAGATDGSPPVQAATSTVTATRAIESRFTPVTAPW